MFDQKVLLLFDFLYLSDVLHSFVLKLHEALVDFRDLCIELVALLHRGDIKLFELGVLPLLGPCRRLCLCFRLGLRLRL